MPKRRARTYSRVSDDRYPKASRHQYEDGYESEEEPQWYEYAQVSSSATEPMRYAQPVDTIYTSVEDEVVEVVPPLSDEQQRVVDLIMEGKNVFYTGSAGCGKSTILKAFVKQLKAQGLKVDICATTNLAALAINGTTLWHVTACFLF
jgi:predicted AAA+ superfamily ATPase